MVVRISMWIFTRTTALIRARPGSTRAGRGAGEVTGVGLCRRRGSWGGWCTGSRRPHHARMRRGARSRGGLLLVGGSRRRGVGGGRPPSRRGAPNRLAPLPREDRGGEASLAGLATRKPTGKRAPSQGSSSSRLRRRSSDGDRMDLAVAAHVLVDGWSKRHRARGGQL